MNLVSHHRTARLAALLLVLGVGGAGFAQERDPAPASQEPPVPGVAVAFDGRVLFTVSEPLGPFTAADRARAAEERIARLANDPFYLPELFRVGVEEDSATAYYQDSPIGVVSAKDAATHGLTAEEGATALIQTVRTAVERYRERNRPAAFLRAAVVTVVATAALVGVLVVLGRLRRRHDRLRRTVAPGPRATGRGRPPHPRDPVRAGPVRRPDLPRRLLRDLRAQRLDAPRQRTAAGLQRSSPVHPGRVQRGGRRDHVAALRRPARRQHRGAPGVVPPPRVPAAAVSRRAPRHCCGGQDKPRR